MEIKVLNKNIKLNREKGLTFQIWLHCFLNNITLNQGDIDILISIINKKEVLLNEFCTNQSIRNKVNRLHKTGLLIKSKKYNKVVKVNPEIQFLSEDTYYMIIKTLVHDKKG